MPCTYIIYIYLTAYHTPHWQTIYASLANHIYRTVPYASCIASYHITALPLQDTYATPVVPRFARVRLYLYRIMLLHISPSAVTCVCAGPSTAWVCPCAFCCTRCAHASPVRGRVLSSPQPVLTSADNRRRRRQQRPTRLCPPCPSCGTCCCPRRCRCLLIPRRCPLRIRVQMTSSLRWFCCLRWGVARAFPQLFVCCYPNTWYLLWYLQRHYSDFILRFVAAKLSYCVDTSATFCAHAYLCIPHIYPHADPQCTFSLCVWCVVCART